MLLAALLVLLQDPSGAAARRPLGWSDFPVFVWREAYAGKPLPAELVEPFGGVILMRDEDSAWARERGLAYLVWNVAGRDALHLDADEAWNARVERWIQTHDESLLVRQPCLNDPATIAQLFATLDATLAKHGQHPGLGFVLGDEVGLTPNGDPFDLCRCGFCEELWRDFAKRARVPERAPLTDAVRLAVMDEDYSTLGSWLARRRFERGTVTHTVMRIRERLLGRPDPGAWPRGYTAAPARSIPCGILGSNGLTAFAGAGFGQWSRPGLLDFLECYPVLDARERSLSVAGNWAGGTDLSYGGFRVSTIFVADETPASAAWKAWEHWLRGGSSLVLWCDSTLEAHPEHLRRLSEAVASIRALMARGVRPRMDARGGAILSDEDSISASFLRESMLDGPTWPRRKTGYQVEHGLRERKVRSWLRLIEDCGELPISVPLAAVGADLARTHHFLVLPEVLVLDEIDVVHLEEFLAAGGTAIVDGTLGWVDRNGRPWTVDVLERVRGKAAERVLLAPGGIDSYPESRLAPGFSTPRAFLRGILEARPRLEPADRIVLPSLGRQASALPWLVNRRIDIAEPAGGRRAVVLLPNLVTPSEQARLADLDVSDAAHNVTWLHPREGTTLRAGDAAVLLLEPSLPPDRPR